MKKIIFDMGLIIFISSLLIFITNKTLSYEYQGDNYNLFYNEDIEILKNDIKIYLSNIDDYLISNASYRYADILRDNYDFLTNFALDYIINNNDKYIDKIIIMNDYSYYDSNYNYEMTNRYIDINEVYKITDKYFGIKDYKIINDNVNIIGNYVSLSDYKKSIFIGNIIDIEIIDGSDIKVIVTYDNGIYQYSFIKINNELKINNVEVIK